MFRKLFSLKPGAKSTHPLGSDENVAELLASIPPDPARTLQELDEWLADCARFEDEIGLRALLRALLRLDAAAETARTALLERYLSPAHREHLSEVLWAAVDQSLRHVAAGYRHCLERQLAAPRQDIEAKDLLLASLRGIAALAARKKLARFRYRPAEPGWWREMHGLLSLVGRLGIANQAELPFDGMAKKLTPLQLYLAAAYIELAPLSNVVPQQVEVIDRLLLDSADTLELAASPGATSTHQIDLAGEQGPIPAGKEAGAPGGALRYLARVRLRPIVPKLATALRASREIPPELAGSGIGREQLQQLGTLLMQHWSEPPPQRGKARHSTQEDLRVVFGFTMARRMIAFTDFARSGRSLEYSGGDINTLFKERHFGGVVRGVDAEEEAAAAPPAAEQPLVVNPIEVLEKLELAGDRQMMENWLQTDVSETGLGVTAPAVRARHRIGGLVCLRYADGIEWHLALIRRIGRDAAGQATLGLETLPWPSVSVRVKPLADDSASTWSKLDGGGEGYLDAILVSQDGNELILPRGGFAADLPIRIRMGEVSRQGALTELVERGEDFDRVRFAAVD